MVELVNFYSGKRVLVTGHTGFKGTWLVQLLKNWGAEVAGYALPADNESLFRMLNLDGEIHNCYSDIRDSKKLDEFVLEFEPEIIFHLAAQALVRSSYDDPKYTYETNVLGALNLLESARKCTSLQSLVFVTSDKCYENNEWCWGYRETDKLGGFDPYSASKAAAEILFSSHVRSFLTNSTHLRCASARAGNVIGGGDYSKDRIIPDCIRAAANNTEVTIRSPNSTRPWQHVLEPLSGYLTLGYRLYEGEVENGSAWNFGPSTEMIITVREVAETIFQKIGRGTLKETNQFSKMHEAGLLQLNCDKAHSFLSWRPKWTGYEAIDKTAIWYADVLNGNDATQVTNQQIRDYFDE